MAIFSCSMVVAPMMVAVTNGRLSQNFRARVSGRTPSSRARAK